MKKILLFSLCLLIVIGIGSITMAEQQHDCTPCSHEAEIVWEDAMHYTRVTFEQPVTGITLANSGREWGWDITSAYLEYDGVSPYVRHSYYGHGCDISN